MNKNIKLAVAGAIFAAASTANAGIIIPAGDWTLDIGGNVNTYVTSTRNTGTATTGYATLMSGSGQGDALLNPAAVPNKSTANITTGLLPNYLSVSGTTRQNDVDVAFTISINPGSSTMGSGQQVARQENRQAFLTFGDKSWGSIKLGKDLGIFASDAILNDMTLLGVGSGAGGLAGNTTTLGRIGTGFMYADWKAQAAYTTPNFGGFQATVGMTQAWDAWSNIVANGSTAGTASAVGDAFSAGRGGSQNAYEGKASYSFAANDVTGKVWVSGMYQKVENLYTNSWSGTATTTSAKLTGDDNVWATDIGANVNVAGFGFTGYYYTGEGIGQTVQMNGGFDRAGKTRDSKGGYVQATYVLPTKTKLGLSWGESKLEKNASGDTMTGNLEDSMWAAGLYHPLTKHLNLVAEYSDVESKYGTATAKGRTGSLGAILFF
jgi:predicted porin